MKTETKTDRRIVVASHGFVFVGMYERDDVLGVVNLIDAHNIRKFGTTNGLGQLAIKGPQKETVLDPCGVVQIPLSSVVCTMQCDERYWK